MGLSFFKKVFHAKSDEKSKKNSPSGAQQSSKGSASDAHWWQEEHTSNWAVDSVQLPFDVEERRRALRGKIEADEFEMIEIPSNILRIINIMNNPSFDFQEVSSLISKSPVLMADFLRVANSSVYNRGVKMTDIRSILPRLGKTTVQAMLYMHAAKLGLAENPFLKDVSTSIVDFSFSVAKISRYLGTKFYHDPDIAFQAGLLHAIGKLAILQDLSENNALPKGFKHTLKESHFDDIFPGLYQEIGLLLARTWKLSDDINFSIANHDSLLEFVPEKKDNDKIILAAIINFSVQCARILGKGKPLNEEINIFEGNAAQWLGLTPEDPQLIQFLDEIPEALEHVG